VAQVELFGAVSGEDEVGVRVHEARQRGAATRIHQRVWRDAVDGDHRRRQIFWPDPDDTPVERGHRRILSDA